MGRDLLIFVGVVLLLFFLWLYSGGPNHPISFAGPYLTPITTVDDSPLSNRTSGSSIGNSGDSISNGNSANEPDSISNDGSGSGGNANSSTGNSIVPTSSRSPYFGEVTISGGNISATKSSDEYITLRSETSKPISISGWQLIGVKNPAPAATLPLATRLLLRSGGSPLSSITLVPGGSAIVVTGSSPIKQSFLETKCTGYLDTTQSFSPSLQTGSCPDPSQEFANFYSGSADRYDECANYIDGVGRCRVPANEPNDLPSSCQNFINNNLSYEGCVQSHKGDSDFSSDTWRIYLGRSSQLWRQSNETIELIDQNGKIVDQYSY